MRLQGAPTFSPEDYPDVPEQLLQRLTEAFDDLYATLASVPETLLLPRKTFQTELSGSAFVDLANPLPARPQSVVVAEFAAADGTPLTSPYAFSWQMVSGNVRLLFVGLGSSSKYVVSVTVS